MLEGSCVTKYYLINLHKIHRIFELFLVTIETFVDQRSRSTPPSMAYTTLENVLDQQEKGNQLKATCSGVTDERTKSHGNTYSKADTCLGYLRAVKTDFVDEALWRYLYRKPRCRTILDKYRRRCRLFRCAVSRKYS